MPVDITFSRVETYLCLRKVTKFTRVLKKGDILAFFNTPITKSPAPPENSLNKGSSTPVTPLFNISLVMVPLLGGIWLLLCRRNLKPPCRWWLLADDQWLPWGEDHRWSWMVVQWTLYIQHEAQRSISTRWSLSRPPVFRGSQVWLLSITRWSCDNQLGAFGACLYLPNFSKHGSVRSHLGLESVVNGKARRECRIDASGALVNWISTGTTTRIRGAQHRENPLFR